MSSLSLDASIRTCKVDAGEAIRIESDRFLNPHNMVCPVWNGYNSKGQKVCADSYYTKTPGCRSALDRVSVENFLRPDYSDYINFNMAGLQGDIYGGNNRMVDSNTRAASEFEKCRYSHSGSFGNQFQATNYSTCGLNSYEKAMAQESQHNRQAAMVNNAYLSSDKRYGSGSCGH
jgi:hypothetical protein